MKLMMKGLSRQAKEVPIQLGKRIKELRKERGLTQEALAESADINTTYLGLIEIGKKVPSLATLIRVAEALKVSVYQLFTFEPDVPSKQRNVQELMEFLKAGNEGEAKFLLAVCKEHRKACP